MRLEVVAPDGVPEVRPGADLAALLADSVAVAEGDIVVITSKVVSKAEGRIRPGDRAQAIAEETVRLVAQRGQTSIVRHHLGLVMAAAGVDASNVEPGWVVLLPPDPDGSARRLRADLRRRTGHNVAVIITDTAGRAWRNGQTDIAIGAAGLVVTEDFSGRVDAYGNPLAVTAPAVADELAGSAELAQGKLAGRPFAVVRGRADLVLPPADDGPGAAALIREEGADLFGYGAREAVVAAVRAQGPVPFGAPVDADELVAALSRAFGPVLQAHIDSPHLITVSEGRRDLVEVVAFVHGWAVEDPTDSSIRLRFRGATT